jgi:hypothetical protein
MQPTSQHRRVPKDHRFSTGTTRMTRENKRCIVIAMRCVVCTGGRERERTEEARRGDGRAQIGGGGGRLDQSTFCVDCSAGIDAGGRCGVANWDCPDADGAGILDVREPGAGILVCVERRSLPIALSSGGVSRASSHWSGRPFTFGMNVQGASSRLVAELSRSFRHWSLSCMSRKLRSYIANGPPGTVNGSEYSRCFVWERSYASASAAWLCNWRGGLGGSPSE